jgi:hypothetical protein
MHGYYCFFYFTHSGTDKINNFGNHNHNSPWIHLFSHLLSTSNSKKDIQRTLSVRTAMI